MNSVEINNPVQCRLSHRLIRETILQALKRLRRGAGEISVVLVDFSAIRRLNRQYRGLDRVTDVLSFAGQAPDEFKLTSGRPPLSGGEIIICYPQASKQAKENGHGVGEEVKILLVHGLLHLLGYDHETAGDAREMEEMEEKILKRAQLSQRLFD